MAYVLPQVEVHQVFKEIPFNTVKNLNAFVFGPHYDLYKFNNPEMQDKLKVMHYKNEGSPVNITGKLSMIIPNFKNLDTEYTNVFAKNMIISKLGSESKIDDITFTTDAYNRTNSFTIEDKSGFNEGEFLAIKKTEDGTDNEVFVGTAKIVDIYKKDGETKWTITTDSNDVKAGSSLYLCDYIAEGNLERSFENFGTDNYSEAYTVEIKESDDKTGYSVVIKGALKYNQAEIYEADLYVQFRCLSHVAADSIYAMERVTDVTSYLGEVDPDNPLAMGVYKACQNSGDRVVYYMATKGNTLDDYSWVLEKASLSEDVYAFVPLTDDRAIMDLVESHVDGMSGPQTKRWRIAFVCPDIPTEDVIFDKNTMPDGTSIEATVTKIDNEDDPDEEYALIEFKNDYDQPETFVDTAKLAIGDIVVLNSNSLPIVNIVDRQSVVVDLKESQLLKNESSLDQVDITCIKHILTQNETAEQIAAQSRGFANRRVYSVFPPVVSSNGVTMHGMHAAAAVAGLMSSVLPQQPLTNVEINGFDDIPMVYTQYSITQLNKIAEGGTFIVMQDFPLDKVYVRHQISTAYSDNNLNTSELSITKNLDAISYFFAERLAPYIGKYNITPQLLGVIRNVISEGLGYLNSTTGVGLYGPMVIAEGTTIDKLYQDPALQDHVQCELTLNLPKPFNVLKLYLNV
jgi:hypothetical protein